MSHDDWVILAALTNFATVVAAYYLGLWIGRQDKSPREQPREGEWRLRHDQHGGSTWEQFTGGEWRDFGTDE